MNNKKINWASCEELMALYEKHTHQEIGEIFNVTRQRSQQVLSDCPGYKPYRSIAKRDIRMRELSEKGLSAAEIAKELNMTYGALWQRLRNNNLPTNSRQYKPIGCDKCKTHPYARDICRACYKRWHSHGKPDTPAVRKEKRRVGPPMKDVGCSKCKTNPIVAGLCGNCYTRKRRRIKSGIPLNYHDPRIDKEKEHGRAFISSDSN